MNKISFVSSMAAFSMFAVGCSHVSDVLTPRSEIDVPARFKYKEDYAGALRADWWVHFRDPYLNGLQRKLVANNQSLKVALANYDASLGALRISKAQRLPRIDGEVSASRNRDSENDRFLVGEKPFFSYRAQVQLGYEVDLWGRVRQVVRRAKAESEAQRLLVEDARLSLQTQLAKRYFTLRFLDAEAGVLRAAVKTRVEAAQLIKNQLDGGMGDALDMSRARSLLASARADLVALERQRDQLEASIAVMVGSVASSFSVSKRSVAPRYLPHVPSGIPANVLTRRPDVGAAYARLEASSARLGIAKAEPYPRLRLVGSRGLLSVNEGQFLRRSSSFYSIGPSLDIPLFAGGRLRGNINRAKGEQAAALATFQQVSLEAFAEVESALAGIRSLKKEALQRSAAVAANTESYELASLRFREGGDSYLSVIDADRERLQTRRALLRTRADQFATTVQLIQALGGGYARNP